MVASPSDREEAARKIVSAAGGQLECWYATTGPTDFMMVVTIDDVSDLLAGVMAGVGSGSFSKMETQRAFTGAEFTTIQKKAGELKSSYDSAA
jgi:uncharacterized protein with GYD domain